MASLWTMALAVLQSTLPHGERLSVRFKTSRAMQLQSTLPHGERRPDEEASALIWTASIHAPARGATDLLRKE